MTSKKDTLDFISRLAKKQATEIAGEFVAPCLKNGRIAVRIAGIACRYSPSDPDFEGWGVFRVSEGSGTAELTGEASRRQVADYLSHLRPGRFRLAYKGLDSSWAAVPKNRGAFECHYGKFGPVAIRLAGSCSRFDAVLARFDGVNWWFESRDRGDNASIRTSMAEAYDSGRMPKVAGASPEDKETFALAVDPKPVKGISSPPTDEEKIRRALERGGGAKLISFVDKGAHWNIVWVTKDGRRSTSSIMKDRGMSVISAGMCLSGRDSDFDLISLVSVVEKRNDYHDPDEDY